MATTSRIYTHELAVLHTSLDIERVPSLVQGASTATQNHGSASDGCQRSLDLFFVIGFVIRGGNSRFFESFICIEALYQQSSALSEPRLNVKGQKQIS